MGKLIGLAIVTLMAACASESDVACTVGAGQCPNVCAAGTAVAGETCIASTDCGCGLFCKVGSGGGRACAPYEQENAGCSCVAAATPVEAPPAGPGVPALGSGTHVLGAMVLVEVGTAKDGLDAPRDLAFNPAVPGQLFVVNYADESVTVFDDAGGTSPSSDLYKSPGGQHFLARPSGIAFGADLFFATIHDTDEKTQGDDGTEADFMGPTLWTADLDIFDAGHGGHMDMLHNSPSGMGIAWEQKNVYWVFDGYHSSLTRYDFKVDHGPGEADHSDGIATRYAEGEVKRVPGTPSHMEYVAATKLLYVADTGNNRVAVLDIVTGKPGGSVSPNYDGAKQTTIKGAALTTLVDGAKAGLVRPSGLAIRGDVLYLSDNATSRIHAFSMTGEPLDTLDTGLPDGSVAGIELDAAGQIFFVDVIGNRVYRIAPAPAR